MAFSLAEENWKKGRNTERPGGVRSKNRSERESEWVCVSVCAHGCEGNLFLSACGIGDYLLALTL